MTGVPGQPALEPPIAEGPTDTPNPDVQDRIIDLVRSSALVSPMVAGGAPITWIPGVQDPWITVTDDAVHLAVIAHAWPVAGMLIGLQERIEMLAAPRAVVLRCVDVDTEHDASELDQGR